MPVLQGGIGGTDCGVPTSRSALQIAVCFSPIPEGGTRPPFALTHPSADGLHPGANCPEISD